LQPADPVPVGTPPGGVLGDRRVDELAGERGQ
jgi:hypothetical protein